MLTDLLRSRIKLPRRLSSFALAATALLLLNASANANGTCVDVVGHYEERIVVEGCDAQSGVCFAGDYFGGIRGDFTGAVTSFVPTGDTPTTGVILFTAESILHARVSGKQGDLTAKNAGAYQAAGAGNVVDVWSITGGTGELADATGVIRASGFSDPVAGTGMSTYEGMICLP